MVARWLGEFDKAGERLYWCMIIKLEVLNKETVHYLDKATHKPAEFEVLNAREAMPATCLQPFRLAARDFPDLVPPATVEFSVSDCRRGLKDSAISLRGKVVGTAKAMPGK